jgi:hypothetical protein
MKVYVVFDMDGWEITGIDKVFSDYDKAVQYLKTFEEMSKGRYKFKESHIFSYDVI